MSVRPVATPPPVPMEISHITVEMLWRWRRTLKLSKWSSDIPPSRLVRKACSEMKACTAMIFWLFTPGWWWSFPVHVSMCACVCVQILSIIRPPASWAIRAADFQSPLVRNVYFFIFFEGGRVGLLRGNMLVCDVFFSPLLYFSLLLQEGNNTIVQSLVWLKPE